MNLNILKGIFIYVIVKYFYLWILMIGYLVGLIEWLRKRVYNNNFWWIFVIL